MKQPRSSLNSLVFSFCTLAASAWVLFACANRLFNNALNDVAIGADDFAEWFEPNSLLKMPWNAVVNIGFVLIGIDWLNVFIQNHHKFSMAQLDALVLLSAFGFVAGPLKFLRVVSQDRRVALLDDV